MTALDQLNATVRDGHEGTTLAWGPESYLTVQLESAESDGALGVTYFRASPGESAPLHSHTLEDELFLIARGSVELRAGDTRKILTAGGCAFLPRGVVHGYTVLDDPAEFFVVTTPGGFERFFIAAGEDPAVALEDRTWSREKSRAVEAEIGTGLKWAK